MEMLFFIVLFMAAIFGLCFGLDRLYHAVFRKKPQHAAGNSVRLPKRTMTAGILLTVMGVFSGVTVIGLGRYLLLIPAFIVLAMGIGIWIYYVSFGIYYDEDSFLVSSFGRPSVTYRYEKITGQALRITKGGVNLNLYLGDESLMLFGTMEGLFPFLDFAFQRWCVKKHREPADCPWHQPEQLCWFPDAGKQQEDTDHADKKAL